MAKQTTVKAKKPPFHVEEREYVQQARATARARAEELEAVLAKQAAARTRLADPTWMLAATSEDIVNAEHEVRVCDLKAQALRDRGTAAALQQAVERARQELAAACEPEQQRLVAALDQAFVSLIEVADEVREYLLAVRAAAGGVNCLPAHHNLYTGCVSLAGLHDSWSGWMAAYTSLKTAFPDRKYRFRQYPS